MSEATSHPASPQPLDTPELPETPAPSGNAQPLETKALLLRYLQSERDAVLWKVEGLDESALRTPRTPTGTNLLGLVKHLAAVEYGYFQMSFGRPTPDLPHLRMDADRLLDFYATPDETPEQIIADYRDAIAAANRTIAELDLDAEAHVPWWPEPTTLERLLVHVAVETARHAGHADIIRELTDGRVGLNPANPNMSADDAPWDGHLTFLRTLAKQAEVGGLGTTPDPTG
ncbi:DinB family protein [Luteococcus sp. Sow4_B9]|uniref:DinB family protein n=1 Tax=Luteococcus sp. Sow4_B9 TaxID=3438792 RepID=UPI003F9C311C